MMYPSPMFPFKKSSLLISKCPKIPYESLHFQPLPYIQQQIHLKSTNQMDLGFSQV